MIALIVDDHPLVHEALGGMLRSVFADAEVLAATTLSQAVGFAKGERRIDLAVLDLGLPDCSGVESLTRFREAAPATRVVVFADSEPGTAILNAIDAGASGFVPKTHELTLIVAALRLVASGGIYVPPEALRASAECSPPKQELTPRQSDVMRLIAKGFGNKEVADRLNITPDTVKQHARAAYRALGVSSRTQAASALAGRRTGLD